VLGQGSEGGRRGVCSSGSAGWTFRYVVYRRMAVIAGEVSGNFVRVGFYTAELNYGGWFHCYKLYRTSLR